MNVVAGLLHVDLWMAENTSLKERRRAVHSIIDRVRARHNVSCAQIDAGTDARQATLAFSCAGASEYQVRKALESVMERIESEFMTEVYAAEIEIR